ncbi:hypothetical protein ACFCV9_32695 [Streptomyces sp. NPDC056367]|uniref:hypothetical protein n=1 Tax=unclassified Streptomyces TaxID=2593676 RepID=UPI0035D7AF6D
MSGPKPLREPRLCRPPATWLPTAAQPSAARRLVAAQAAVPLDGMRRPRPGPGHAPKPPEPRRLARRGAGAVGS